MTTTKSNQRDVAHPQAVYHCGTSDEPVYVYSDNDCIQCWIKHGSLCIAEAVSGQPETVESPKEFVQQMFDIQVKLDKFCEVCPNVFSCDNYRNGSEEECVRYVEERDRLYSEQDSEAVSGQPETVPGDAIGGIELTEADVEALVLPNTVTCSECGKPAKVLGDNRYGCMECCLTWSMSTETPKDNYPDGCCDSDIDADYLSKVRR